jgi:ketosteroid isomerase-like protein
VAGEARRAVAELFSCIESGDVTGAMELIHPSARWAPTVWSSGGILVGTDAIRAWFARFGPRLEHLRIDVAEILGEGGLITVLGTVHDTRGGSPFSVQVGWTFAMADGRMIEGRAFPTWEEARAAGGVRASATGPGE